MKTFFCMVLCTAVWLSSSTAMAQVCPNGVQQRKEFRQLTSANGKPLSLPSRPSMLAQLLRAMTS